MDLRKRVRYRLGTRAVFTWENPKSNQLKGVGVTRDISPSGVFIFSSACPAVDTTVRLNIFLPPSKKGVPGIRIVSEATVVRVEHTLESDKLSGFAVANETFTLYEGAQTSS